MVIAGELVEQRMAELMELGAQPMDEDDRPPLPRFGVVDAVAVDVDELAGWRHHLLGARGDLAGGEDEIAGDQCRADHQDRENRRNDSRHRQFLMDSFSSH